MHINTFFNYPRYLVWLSNLDTYVHVNAVTECQLSFTMNSICGWSSFFTLYVCVTVKLFYYLANKTYALDLLSCRILTLMKEYVIFRCCPASFLYFFGLCSCLYFCSLYCLLPFFDSLCFPSFKTNANATRTTYVLLSVSFTTVMQNTHRSWLQSRRWVSTVGEQTVLTGTHACLTSLYLSPSATCTCNSVKRSWYQFDQLVCVCLHTPLNPSS